jgi:hypothetical protein
MSFAIIASPRTGSTHLTNLLHAQSDIFCNGEICHAKRVNVRWDKIDRSNGVLYELAILRERDPREFLNRILAMNYGRKEVGFKILKGQSRAMFDAILNDPSIKKVVLFRRNVLANYSSKLIAAQSGEYALRGKNVDEQRPASSTVPFDEDEFLRFSQKYNRYYDGVMSKLRQSGQYYHVINYEDINEPEFFGNLLRFLGSECSEKASQGRNVKQNPAYILSRFSNTDTVEDFLRRHNLLYWTYEGELSFVPLETGGAAQKKRKSFRRRETRMTGGSAL